MLKKIKDILIALHKSATNECIKYIVYLVALGILLYVIEIPAVNNLIYSTFGNKIAEVINNQIKPICMLAAGLLLLLVIYNAAVWIVAGAKYIALSIKKSWERKSIDDLLKEQLPKRNMVYNFLQALSFILVPVTVSFTLIYVAVNKSYTEVEPFVMITGLATLAVVSGVFYSLFMVTIKGKYRTSNSIPHLHYCIHKVRDYLAGNANLKIDDVLDDIVNTISDSFRLVCDSTCYVTFKGLTDGGLTVTEVVSDKYYYVDYAVTKHEKHSYQCNDFSSISNILHNRNGCSRYYLCNNIKRGYKKHVYWHPLIDKSVVSVDNFGRIRNWPHSIRHKATLVVPVRCGTDFIGFLCIDSMKKGAFDRNYCVELAAAYVDLLYVLLTQTEEQLRYGEGKHCLVPEKAYVVSHVDNNLT